MKLLLWYFISYCHFLQNDAADMLVMTVHAVDEDSGENGRVTYHFKVKDSNVQETEEFSIDPDTGELRAKIILDRETKPSYQVRYQFFIMFVNDRWNNIRILSLNL